MRWKSTQCQHVHGPTPVLTSPRAPVRAPSPCQSSRRRAHRCAPPATPLTGSARSSASPCTQSRKTAETRRRPLQCGARVGWSMPGPCARVAASRLTARGKSKSRRESSETSRGARR
eukprot:365661-Chlamydomonas_euryale.AAC.74